VPVTLPGLQFPSEHKAYAKAPKGRRARVLLGVPLKVKNQVVPFELRHCPRLILERLRRLGHVETPFGWFTGRDHDFT
jgi:hypothetical protein